MRIALIAVLALTGACTAPRAGIGLPDPDRGAAADPWGPPGSSARGEILVRTRCSSCHATGRFDTSPLQAAPPFRGLAQRYPVGQLQEALAEGLVTAHPAMPQVELEPDDIADVIAYLDSIGSSDAHNP